MAHDIVVCAQFFCILLYIYNIYRGGQCHTVISNLAINAHNFVSVGHTCASEPTMQCILLGISFIILIIIIFCPS